MRRGPTIEQVGGFVTVHAALPPNILKWTVRLARKEGHKDISLVIQRGLEVLRRQRSPRRQ